MTLEAKLQQIRDDAKSRIPEEMRAVMQKATEELRASGITETALQAGATLPPFSLKNMAGDTVSSDTLLAKGPLVLTFYRGVW